MSASFPLRRLALTNDNGYPASSRLHLIIAQLPVHHFSPPSLDGTGGDARRRNEDGDPSQRPALCRPVTAG